MNKLLTKIVGVVIGTSMAVGVGTAVVAKNSQGINSEVNATVDSLVTIGTGSYISLYETGFENATTSTTYNTTKTYASNQCDGASWEFYYGTVATNAKITGSNSGHMRWYSSATANHPYAMTTSNIDDVAAFKFNYAVGNTNVKFDVLYSSDNGSNWSKFETVSPANTNTALYQKEIGSTIAHFRLKVLVSDSSTAPSSGNYTFRIDDVVFGKVNSAPTVAVTGVSLNKGSTTIAVGDSETLTATVSPSDATNKAVTWTSSKENVATVSEGVITPVDAGSTTITVTTTDGSFTATCNVTVTLPSYTTETVAQARTTISALSNNTTTSAYYRVEGYITAITESYNPTYGNISFTIADTKGGSDTIVCFRAKVDSELASDLIVTAKVRMIGQYEKYVNGNTTKLEMVNILPSTIEVLEAGQQAEVHVVSFAEALDVFEDLESGQPTFDKYTVTGYVTSIVNAYANGKMSFNFGATDESTDVIEVYNIVLTAEQAATVQVGACVTVTGNLELYNTTNELVNGENYTLVSAPVTKYTVTYDGNGNTGGTAPEAARYNENTVVTVAGNTGSLVKTGYNFGGWNTSADGTGTNYAAGSGTFTITGNITLYAKWTAKVFNSLRLVDGTPDTTTYIAGQNFDPTGLVVYATYDSVEVETNVAASLTWTPSPLTEGTTSVTGSLTVGGVTDTVTVTGLTVNPAPLSETFDLSSTGYVGTELVDGVSEGPVTLQATKVGIDAWRSNHENLRVYQNAELTITGNSSVASIDTVVITAAGSYTVSGNYSIVAMPSEDDITYDAGGMDMPANTTSVVITRTTSGRADLSSITVYYSTVEAEDKDVESVTVTPSTKTLEIGETFTPSVEVLPADARDLSVTWKVSDETTDVVTVGSDGLITAIGAGTKTIQAISNDQPSIHGECVVTVNPAPLINYSASAKIQNDGQNLLGDTYFTLSTSGSGSFRGYEATRGAQFSSSSNDVSVELVSTDTAVATKDLRVILNASRNNNGTATASIKVGNTSLKCNSETEVTLTNTATDYEFVFDGSGSATADLSNLLTINLNNTGGAIYLKSIKVYSAAKASVLNNFLESQLRMSTYDQNGTIGSEGGNGSCKTWFNDVKNAYLALSDGQKALFASLDAYSAARSRLSEWARINNYSFDADAGTITQLGSRTILPGMMTDSAVITTVIVLSVLSITTLGGYFLLRKRKEER